VDKTFKLLDNLIYVSATAREEINSFVLKKNHCLLLCARVVLSAAAVASFIFVL
jgi:hypothetical protein